MTLDKKVVIFIKFFEFLVKLDVHDQVYWDETPQWEIDHFIGRIKP